MGVDRGESEKYLVVVDVASRWVLVAVEASPGRERNLARIRIAGFEDIAGAYHKKLFGQGVWSMWKVGRVESMFENLEMRSLPIPARRSGGT